MHIAIIGNGISGITAARYIRKKSDSKITVISAESEFFFSRTALMYIYMGHMRTRNTQPYEKWFWAKNRIDLREGFIENVDVNKKELRFKGGEVLGFDKLIIATGSVPNKFGWPGQDLDGVGGFYSLQDLERIEARSNSIKHAVIIGGGLIGVELAESFHSRGIKVTFLVRENNFWRVVMPLEESKMINQEIIESGIDLRLGVELKEIIDDGTGKACAVITSTGERIDCEFVGLTAGVHPNIDFLKGSGVETGRGVLVNKYLQTNHPDIYAIGDCSEHLQPEDGRRPIEAVWYTGKMMGKVVAGNILGEKTKYKPRLWFNSAKFINIEYQVYGFVAPNLPEAHESIIWIHEDNKKSIRIVYDKKNKNVLGFNLMGIRFRHEVCEKWIEGSTHIEEVLSRLSLANFDPEFFTQYEKYLVEKYNESSGKSIKLTSKRSWNRVYKFLKS